MALMLLSSTSIVLLMTWNEMTHVFSMNFKLALKRTNINNVNFKNKMPMMMPMAMVPLRLFAFKKKKKLLLKKKLLQIKDELKLLPRPFTSKNKLMTSTMPSNNKLTAATMLLMLHIS